MARNNFLRENLAWGFGGKAQRGWALYTPLISNLLKTDSQPDSQEFHEALTRWQRRTGLPDHGLLDQVTWMKMVEYWQVRRAQDRLLAAPENLVTVTAQEFYDPERPVELRQVERETYAAYKRLLRAATKDLDLDKAGDSATGEETKYLKIISAFRSPDYQRKLRALSPKAGTAGLAINSPHFTGRTLDLYVGGDPVSTKNANRALQVNTKAYRWLVKNAARFGFIPYFYEPWHWEYNPQAFK